MEKRRITVAAGDKKLIQPFVISDFEAALVADGGWVNYADAAYRADAQENTR